MATHGQPEPDLAVELDKDGRQDDENDENDEFADLSDEEPLPPPVDISQARPAPLCGCQDPLVHDE